MLPFFESLVLFAKNKNRHKKIKKYRIEIGLVVAALCITLVSIVLFITSKQPYSNNEELVESLSQTIFIDISGAIQKPAVYESTQGARLKDILFLAGGLSDEADVMYFNRNFNLARFVSDQEKIYVPSISETAAGIIVENRRNIDYTAPLEASNYNTTPEESTPQTTIVHINTASIEELDTLPGVGPATVQKIIQNKPYSSIDELLTKKIVNQSVFVNIKGLIDL